MATTDVRRLRAVMALHGDTGKSLARKLGLHPSTLSKTLNGRREFRVGEALKICELYQLTPAQVATIFFSGGRHGSV